jgi:hypothetical protein
MERQEILVRSDPAPPLLHVVLSEAVLRRPVGGREVMRGQLESLLRPRDRGNVTVQVIPFDAGVHPAMVGPFTAMSFSDPEESGIVNVENATGTLFLEDAAEVRQLAGHRGGAGLEGSRRASACPCRWCLADAGLPGQGWRVRLSVSVRPVKSPEAGALHILSQSQT